MRGSEKANDPACALTLPTFELTLPEVPGTIALKRNPVLPQLIQRISMKNKPFISILLVDLWLSAHRVMRST